MSLWDAWKASRQVRRAAERYALESWQEPSEEDVRWLAREVAAGDEDHARWELRYLRRALAQLVAERDGFDDRTGAAVATALADRLRGDRGVAQERMAMAERQSNVRLSRYRETLRERGPGPLPGRLALALVQLAAPGRPVRDEEPELAALVERELLAAQERLRDIFGVAALPDDVRPSDALNRR